MYKSFRVQNFRGFKDLQLDDLARVNLIAGKNNTGKTALLEALLIYSGDYNASRLLRMPATRFYRTRLREMSESSRSDSNIPSWNILFNNFDTKKFISLSGKFKEQHPDQQRLFPKEEIDDELSVSLVDSSELPDDSWILRFLGGEIDRGLMPLGQMETLRFKSGEEPPFHLAQFMGSIISDRRSGRERTIEILNTFLPSNEQVSLHDDATRFTNLKRARQQERLLEALRTIEPRLQGLELFYDGDPPVINGDLDGLEYALPITSMGEGMRRLMSLLLAISSTPNGVVLIDEIENGLHHSGQVEVWKAIAEAARFYNVQVFATTHSYEMIQAAHEAFKELKPFDFRLFGLRRKRKSNEIRAVSYDEETLDAALDMYLEMR